MSLTARNYSERRLGLTGIALLLVVGLSGRPACAQSVEGARKLIVLNRKNARRLVVKDPAPEYPALAKINYIQGKVRVLATVGEDGVVAEVHVVSGHPFLALAALKAVSTWLFRPARLRDGPPEFMTYVDVRFALTSRKIEEMPSQPERDLKRQIHPPKLLEDPEAEGSHHAPHVRLRILVGPEGDVVDSLPLGGAGPLLAQARRIVDCWKFQPAHWGALPVPWYLDVDVPVENWPRAQCAAETAGH